MRKKKNLYLEFKNQCKKELDNFPKFFAFSKEQFDTGMKKLGLKPDETNKLVRIYGSGFIRKKDLQKFNSMIDTHNKMHEFYIANDKTGKGYIKDMFSYELANHEFGYTRDLSETLNACCLSRKDIEENFNLKNGLNLALKDY